MHNINETRQTDTGPLEVVTPSNYSTYIEVSLRKQDLIPVELEDRYGKIREIPSKGVRLFRTVYFVKRGVFGGDDLDFLNGLQNARKISDWNYAPLDTRTGDILLNFTLGTRRK